MDCHIVTVGHDVCDRHHRFARPDGFPFWLLGCLFSGSSIMTIGEATMRFEPGWVTLLPAQTGYSVRFGGGREPWTSIWIAILPTPEWDGIFALPELPVGVRGVFLRGHPHETEIRSTFRLARQWFVSGKADWEQFAANSAERILMLAHDAARDRPSGCRDPRIEDARRHLIEHMGDPHAVETLAACAHLSPPRFAALFRKEVGLSPMRYLEKLRMDRAREQLLGTALPVREIARALGFSNQHHFSARFRRATGQSPVQYRFAPRVG